MSDGFNWKALSDKDLLAKLERNDLSGIITPHGLRWTAELVELHIDVIKRMLRRVTENEQG